MNIRKIEMKPERVEKNLCDDPPDVKTPSVIAIIQMSTRHS